MKMNPSLRIALLSIAVACSSALLHHTPAHADRVRIALDADAATEPVSGRLVLHFITHRGPMWDGRSPLEAPFFERPQPLASFAIESLKPGEVIELDLARAVAFPENLNNSLDGFARVQAVLDIDQTERAMLEGPGNIISDEIGMVFSAASDDDVIELTLRDVVGATQMPEIRDLPNLKWVECRSELLSEFYGRDVYHRAGVALPKTYDSQDKAEREWPSVYIVPGFGDRQESAAGYAEMHLHAALEYVPQAVFIVLDPESPLGHHGFVDSANHGPRGTALVNEFIPHLESQFRMKSSPEARVLMGHSSGGWSTLWLQLNWEETFGSCWSLAPDPVSFACFQFANLYTDASLYSFAPLVPGNESPSYRVVDLEGRSVVYMTVREEYLMEHAIDPDGRSGQQWAAWAAMFSPHNPKTGSPYPLADFKSGLIDRAVVEHWRQFDIYNLIARDWERHRPTLENKIHLLCGECDNYYLDRAVRHLKELVDIRVEGDGKAWQGPGVIEIVRYAAHDSIVALTTVRVHDEIMAHFRKHGLHD
ncbi:MAG: alpha/beta hydrolase-fold protein [Phycisphaerales bacterium]